MTQGKAFVLFTSYQTMQKLADTLASFFRSEKIACLVQGGAMPRHRLLQKFKEDRDSVLFGTDSFWQGVDVPGEALSNVILTRLPFAVPDHPLTQAKCERIIARGRRRVPRILAARGDPEIPPGRGPAHPHAAATRASSSSSTTAS